MQGTVLDMRRGDTMKWTFNITDPNSAGYSQTLAGATVYFTAKRDRSDADADAVFTKTCSIIQNGSSSTPGIVTAQLAQVDTTGLPAYDLALYWDLVVVDGASNHYTAASGVLNVFADVKTAQ
jgi:hypothetical protein